MSSVTSSKFLSLVLRHQPQLIGITLDDSGWVDVDELLAACAAHGKSLTRAQLDELVASSDKQRFALSEDGTQIRANQGHSVKVDLDLPPAVPPEILLHGTFAGAIEAIKDQGLLKGSRHHVHLSVDATTAKKVGGRRGVPIILTVAAGAMHRDGHVFYVTANNVWLVDAVPAKYLTFP